MTRKSPGRAINDFGRRVAEERLRWGWTQADLAERAEVSVRYIQSVEQGRENLTLRSAEQMAEVLSVPLQTLLAPPTMPKAPRGRPPGARVKAGRRTR